MSEPTTELEFACTLIRNLQKEVEGLEADKTTLKEALKSLLYEISDVDSDSEPLAAADHDAWRVLMELEKGE